MKFYNSDQQHYVEIIIQPNHENLAVMMSGGPDSALLTYLMIKTIQEEKHSNVRIFPVTAELLKRPFNIRYAEKCIETLADITGFTNWGPHLTFDIPAEHCLDDDKKIELMREHTRRFTHEHDLHRFYNGTTKNPPPEIEWLYNDGRMPERDTPEEDLKPLEDKYVSWPLLYSHKRHVSDLYKKYELLESLFPKTRSCEGETDKTLNHTIVCKKCWWCKERYWGFGVYE